MRFGWYSIICLNTIPSDRISHRFRHREGIGAARFTPEITCTERIAEAGIEPSVDSAGDSYDNALAESVI